MNDSNGKASRREYLWFSVLLIVLLMAFAANFPAPSANSARQETPTN